MTDADVELDDVRKALLPHDVYKQKIAWYKRQKLRELYILGYEEIGGVDLSNPMELDREYVDEDFWRRKTRDLWEEKSPETDAEIFEWYGQYDEYLAENMIRQAMVADDIRHVYRWFRETDAERVLDYGGGAGDFALYFDHKGYNVAYADVEGSFPELMRRRLRYRGNNDVLVREITEPHATPRDVVKSTDAAICLEVMEHLPHIEQVIDGFADVIEPGGYLATSWTFSDWADDESDVYTPCHLHKGRRRTRQVTNYLELYFREVDSDWNDQLRLWQRSDD